MRMTWVRCKKWCVVTASGGVTLGVLQGFSLVNFANLWTTLLITWLSALITLLLGGTATQTPGLV